MPSAAYDIDALIRSYHAGTTLQELADRHDMSRPTLIETLKQHGVQIGRGDDGRRLRRQLPPEQRKQRLSVRGVDVEAVCRDYLDGASMDAVRKKYSLGPSTVAAILKEARIKTHRNVHLRGRE